MPDRIRIEGGYGGEHDGTSFVEAYELKRYRTYLKYRRIGFFLQIVPFDRVYFSDILWDEAGLLSIILFKIYACACDRRKT